MSAPASCNKNTLHLNWSSRQITLHAAIHDRTSTRPRLHSLHEARQLCSIAHLRLCMKFTAPSRHCVFTLQLKSKGRASGSKSVSSWLQTEEIEVNALYHCLHWAVYPSNVQTAKRAPRGHQFLLCIQLSRMLPFSQTQSLTQTHTHTSSI